MENILYLDDYINLYNKDLNKIIVYKPYKNTLYNGRIINKEKFIKIYNKMLKEYNLSNKIFGSDIKVIINKFISNEDKSILNNVLMELNYKKIKYIKELEYLKIKKKDLYIIYNYNYFYLYYLDDYGNIKSLIYNYDKINNKLILTIIKLLNKEDIYIYGKNYEELLNLIKNTKINYYYFYDSNNLIINKILNEK